MLKLLLASALLLTPCARGDSDPLLTRMSGHWSATGVRRYVALPASQARVEIEAETHAELDAQGLLTSKNQLSEIEYDAQGGLTGRKTYERDYWIRQSDVPSAYVLGGFVNGAPGQISSQGSWGDDGVLRVTQPLGNGYRIESDTTFMSDSITVYHEVFYQDARRLSETTLNYQRKD